MSAIHDASGGRLPAPRVQAHRVLAMLVACACASMPGQPAHAQLSSQALLEQVEVEQAWLESIYGEDNLVDFYVRYGFIARDYLISDTEFLLARGVTPIELREVFEGHGFIHINNYRQWYSRYSRFFSDQDLAAFGYTNLQELARSLQIDAFGSRQFHAARADQVLTNSSTPEEALTTIRDGALADYYAEKLLRTDSGDETSTGNAGNNNNNNNN